MERKSAWGAIALIVFGLLSFPTAAQAVTTTVDGLTYEFDSAQPETGATITGHSGTFPRDLILPSEITVAGVTYPVTAVGDRAFYQTGVNSLVVPGSIKTIGSYAFAYTGLSDLVLEDGVQDLGDHAFYGTNLGTLTLPSSIESLGWGSFDSASLTQVIFAPGLKQIGPDAFRENQLTSVELPEGLEILDSGAFFNNVISHISIPSSLAIIGDGAFRWNSLESVTIPGTVQTIGYEAFESNPLTTVDLGEGIETIGIRAFTGTELTSLTIPASITLIKAESFRTGLPWMGQPETLTQVHFLGNAPVLEKNGGAEVFNSPPFGSFDGKTLTFICGATGFSVPEWEGYLTSANCTVKFDGNGGTSPQDATVRFGEQAQAPADPTREGHRFTGWFIDAAGTEAYDFSENVEQPLTLFAGWEKMAPTIHTISFETSGGTEVPPTRVEHGAKLVLPAPPTRTGYTFSGWFLSPDSTQPYKDDQIVTEDFTLYAGWQAETTTEKPETPKPDHTVQRAGLSATGAEGSAWAVAAGAVLLLAGFSFMMRKLRRR